MAPSAAEAIDEGVRAGVRIAVDAGAVRVGLAASDPGGLLATPVSVVRRDRRGERDLEEIAAVVAAREPLEVLVGLPRSLSGAEGAAAATARDYAAALARRLSPVPVRLVDERLTTVQATRGLQAAGVRAREARGVVDAAAAVVLLQYALDHERSTGNPPGEQVDVR
ncbi:MAG TPA: Holliday junction resolvase RuvX [Mycobacteriales bacterium]|nr:Holliday junction resolvase RuvX [Mycobacteriales bacterium]